ncbi:MAG: hypothetical protein LBL52_03995 [Rickettsiales bacterium]|nr:hypothetical protein [Rickettsiales bacterium]
MPGACVNAGRSADCKLNAVLSIEEFTDCLGSPAFSRWTKVRENKKDIGALGRMDIPDIAPGIYMLVSTIDGSNFHIEGVVLENPVNSLILHYFQDSTGYGYNSWIYETGKGGYNMLVQARATSDIINVPNISKADFQVGNAAYGALYKLN